MRKEVWMVVGCRTRIVEKLRHCPGARCRRILRASQPRLSCSSRTWRRALQKRSERPSLLEPCRGCVDCTYAGQRCVRVVPAHKLDLSLGGYMSWSWSCLYLTVRTKLGLEAAGALRPSDLDRSSHRSLQICFKKNTREFFPKRQGQLLRF